MRWPTPPTGPDGAGITNTAPSPATTPATELGSHDQRSTTAVLPGPTRGGLPPAPPPCCDREGGEGLSPPLEYTAPHGAPDDGRKLTPYRQAGSRVDSRGRRNDDRVRMPVRPASPVPGYASRGAC